MEQPRLEGTWEDCLVQPVMGREPRGAHQHPAQSHPKNPPAGEPVPMILCSQGKKNSFLTSRWSLYGCKPHRLPRALRVWLLAGEGEPLCRAQSPRSSLKPPASSCSFGQYQTRRPVCSSQISRWEGREVAGDRIIKGVIISHRLQLTAALPALVILRNAGKKRESTKAGNALT